MGTEESYTLDILLGAVLSLHAGRLWCEAIRFRLPLRACNSARVPSLH